MLCICEKAWSNVLFTVGYNCKTNKCLADMRKVPLIECASHRFNLLVDDISENYEDVLSTINRLITKLKGFLLRAKLRKVTSLTSKTRNIARWSSSFYVAQRYFPLLEYLPQIHSTATDDLCLTPAENRCANDFAGRNI